jgi:DNA polymerase-3 subunit gamma/tau
MSYQALARKWRPRDFSALVGQDHVVRALANALQTRRLHHAYLFTGTRGVGKTTIARILAKALNCIGPDGAGDITPTPCNVCAACTAIDAGRFVDYVEMDAASNRGVDEMTQLLERAAYAPSNARFKVYTIDEVHMLTAHAFNAMLKTLEEPPDYVKFILATTDPQKIPVTVLSRCLQFNLKQVAPATIAERLALVLQSEGLAADPVPLRTLAAAARGSMRDALSLLDQAIVFSAGSPTAESVRQMLGAIDATVLVQLLDAVLDGQGPRVLALADAMAESGFAFSQALRDLASLLHRIALAQGLAGAPDPADAPEPAGSGRADAQDDVQAADPGGEALEGASAALGLADGDDIGRLARKMPREQVQMLYQIALHGRDDLSLAPDEYAGFTMTLLRMLAFAPELAPAAAARGAAALAANKPLRTAAPLRGASSPAGLAAPVAKAAPAPSERTAGTSSPAAPAAAAARAPGVPAAPAASAAPAAPAAAQATPPLPAAHAEQPPGGDAALDWPALSSSLKLAGLARELALRSELVAREGDHFTLRVPVRALCEAGNEQRLRSALSEHLGRPARLTIEIGAVTGDTAASRGEQSRAGLQRRAEDAIYADPFVRELIENFGASVDPRSIRPLAPDA